MLEHLRVAPFAGAWIEIAGRRQRDDRKRVAPFAGAWIEIVYSDLAGSCEYSRSLRGSVD